MGQPRDVRWSDIEQAVQMRDPQFAELVVSYMEQDDPPEDRDEDSDETANVPQLSREAWTLRRLQQTAGRAALEHKPQAERQAIRAAAWQGLLAAPHPPPRLKLGQLLVELYETNGGWERAALIEVFSRARLGLGLWQGFKRIYKLAEARHDVEMFGVLAWRLDVVRQSPRKQNEISWGTLIYLRRRAWRYLRELGTSIPDVYPQFVVSVLRHYTANTSFNDCSISSQIWGHALVVGESDGIVSEPADEMKHWAFPEAWKRSADPLLRVLEDAQANEVCAFAIIGIREAFPELLRQLEPGYLVRLGEKRLASVHTFIVQILADRPEFHPSKLAELGLHDLVVSLLESPSSPARAYAIEYARAHAPELELELLLRLVEGASEPAALALERLQKLPARTIGLPALVRLLGTTRVHKLATKKIREAYTVDDLDAELFGTLYIGNRRQESFLTAWYREAKQEPPAALIRAVLERPQLALWRVRRILDELGKRPAREIGLDWIQTAVLDPRYRYKVAPWLEQGKVQGDDVDVEWLKGLVMRPDLRSTALTVLGNPQWVTPAQIGVPWLLAMLRQADPALRLFAHQHMLSHFAPEDFATGEGSGLDRLWGLLGGQAMPEAMRVFAAAYLRVHHPVLGPASAEARELDIKPRLTAAAYAFERVGPWLQDPRPDVRRFAADVADQEIGAWGDFELPYQLAASRYREPRTVGGQALLRLADPDVSPDRALPQTWLLASEVFALAESPHQSTREVALTMVRRHYAEIGGAEKLAWLMESPDREVRLFAVRLLWEKHRPRELGAVKQRDERAASPGPGERFDAPAALQSFLRTVLFGLPPGRMERREHGSEGEPDRPLSASDAKRRLIGVLRDVAVEDAGFAGVVLPVLDAFRHSAARGERDACLAALAALRRAHPALHVGLPESQIQVRTPRRKRWAIKEAPAS